MEFVKEASDSVGKYLIPDLPSVDEVLPYLRQIDERRWYSNFGPLVCDFEERLQHLLSEADEHPDWARIQLTTLTSGHHALEAGLALLGIGTGKRVLLPALTFTSCPLAVLRTGAEVVLADVDPCSWTLTPRIARAVAGRMRIEAVMPVAVYGIPLPTSEWDEFSAETGIPVLIDAAAAIETQQIPRLGLVAHSLHATKPFGVGEGGLLVGRDPELTSRGRRYSNFGMVDRICHSDGSNAKMSEYHAAIGLAQLNRWKEVKLRRSRLLQLYQKKLASVAELAALHPSVEQSVVSCLMVLLKRPVAECVVSAGRRAGIGFHQTYLPPLYHHPHFCELPSVKSDGMVIPSIETLRRKTEHLANCEELRLRLVGVPFHPFMDANDVDAVVANLHGQLFAESTALQA